MRTLKAINQLQNNRLYFLDTVRAFAILMMLQGHFIYTFLDPIYRDKSNLIYNVWNYFRGITAPIFFTISGLVFTYLLLKAKARNEDHVRLKKGVQRAILLIATGYLLRIPFTQWIKGCFPNYNFLAIDVLQTIGVCLLLLMFVYYIFKKNITLFGIVLKTLGILCFVLEPLYRNATFDVLPLAISNYFTKTHGSIFTILPWFGYIAMGGFIAVLFNKFQAKKNFKLYIISAFVFTGVILIYYSSSILVLLYKITQINVFHQSASYNYLFTRLGNVLLFFAFFYSLESYLKQALISKIGEKTLSIYVIHFIIIFGSFTGYGLNKFLYHKLTPIQAIIGALIFIIVVCFISFNYVKPNTIIYNKIRRIWTFFKLKIIK